VGEVELCVEDFGDPDDPTILLVHGAAAAMDWWDAELCGRLAAAGRHVVRYDHRDTGRSTTGEPGQPAYDGSQLDRDCEGLIEALGAGAVHLVGLSMGGGIAQAIALRRPDLLRTLTLVDTTAVGGVDTDLPGPTTALAATFAHPPPDPDWADADSYADWVVAGQRPYAGSPGLDEERARTIARAIHARSHDVAAANNHWIAVSSPSKDDAEPLDVRRIAVPTLVLHGTDDPLFPVEHGRALAAAIPDASFVELPGTGHETPPPPTWDLVVRTLVSHSQRAGPDHHPDG
jgi:pimeloyl-ACP methyl ester carboxylesterase